MTDPAAEGQAPPNKLTINAKLHKSNAVVSFRSGGDEPDCISIISTVNDGNGNVKIKIKAVKPSTPNYSINGLTRKSNGTLIEAVHKGKVVGKGKFYVLQPKYLVRGERGETIKDTLQMAAQKPGLSKWAEHEGQPVSLTLLEHNDPPSEKTYAKSYIHTTQVEIQDQYKKPLSKIYAGTGAEEDGIWIAWCQNGNYDDLVGPAGHDMIFPTEEKITEFGVSVAGHEIGTIRRKLSISNDDGQTADYKLTWD